MVGKSGDGQSLSKPYVWTKMLTFLDDSQYNSGVQSDNLSSSKENDVDNLNVESNSSQSQVSDPVNSICFSGINCNSMEQLLGSQFEESSSVMIENQSDCQELGLDLPNLPCETVQNDETKADIFHEMLPAKTAKKQQEGPGKKGRKKRNVTKTSGDPDVAFAQACQGIEATFNDAIRNNENDEDSQFGQFVASKLRKIENPKLKTEIQSQIISVFRYSFLNGLLLFL